MSRDLTNEEMAAFLQDLNALAVKHRIAIGGCGCCGSPYLYGLSHEDLAGGRYGFGSLEDERTLTGDCLTYYDESKRRYAADVVAHREGAKS